MRISRGARFSGLLFSGMQGNGSSAGRNGGAVHWGHEHAA